MRKKCKTIVVTECLVLCVDKGKLVGVLEAKAGNDETKTKSIKRGMTYGKFSL